MEYFKIGNRVLLGAGFQTKRSGGDGVRVFSGVGFPKSGTYAAGGTGVNASGQGAPNNSVYIDETSGVHFVNEGSLSSPYWTPVDFNQRGLYGVYEDWRHGDGLTGITATTASVTRPSGLRVHGEGIAETDSGTVTASTDQGHITSVRTTDEALHTIQLSSGFGTTSNFKPSVNGTMAIDAIIAQETAITERHFFFGFATAPADNNAPILVGGTVTITIGNTIGDDFAGLYFSSALTAADQWHVPFDKANTNATLTSTSFLPTVATTVAAAGTYQRLRVEVDATGAFRAFIDKVLVYTGAAASLTTTTAINPTVQLGVPTAITAVKSFLCKQIAMWGVRA